MGLRFLRPFDAPMPVVHTFPPSSISLYIHWPFCLSKCPYCGFNSYPVLEVIDFEQWKEAYRFALQSFAKTTRGRPLRSIYFGGGTPSLLPASVIRELLEEINVHWPISSGLEISLEINPGTVDDFKLTELRAAGITRASVGVQSLNNEGIAILGRRHDVKLAIQTVRTCARLFDSVSVDMIYARPGHTREIWKEELELALSLDIPHLSLYQLVLEEQSVFGDLYYRGELLLPPDDLCADLFEMTQEMTEKAGLPAYEISNHARSNHECLHNIGYWLYYDYVGIGPGAHSRVNYDGKKFALVHEAQPKRWLKSIIEDGYITEERSELSALDQAKEALLVGLRMVEGVDVSRFAPSFDQVVNAEALDRLLREEYLLQDGDRLRATASGRERLNAVLAYLLKG